MTNQVSGQRTILTILFADIVGSTDLFAQFDDDDVSAIYQSFMQDAAVIAENNGGFVNQSLGDGLMIVFGLQKDHEKHALMACQTAMELHAAFINIDLRIGIHTGSAIVEKNELPSGPLLRITGRTINRAAKLEQAARPRETLLSEQTVDEVGDAVTAKFFARHRFGEENVKTYQLTALRRNGGPKKLSAFRLQDFVGRDFELAGLLHRFRRAEADGPEINLIAGPAGIGKSRLAAEFRARIDPDIPVLHYNFLPSGTIRSNCFKNLFDQIQALAGDVDAEPIKMDNLLLEQARAELAGADAADDAWRKLDHNTKLNFKAAVLWRLLETLPAPLVIIFEDIHWADQEVKFFLNTRRGAQKIFILLTTRDTQELVSLNGQPLFSRVILQNFTDSIGRALLEKWLGTSATLSTLKRDILSASGGNPLFLHEMVAALLKGGQLMGRMGHFICVDKNTSPTVPASLRSLLSTRVQGLRRPLQDCLAAMAVIGLRVDRAMLEKIVPDADAALDEHLAELQRHGLLIREDNVFAEYYYFAHALIHNSAYETILKARRIELHRQVFALLQEAARRRRKNIAALAHHAFHGNLYVEAFLYNFLAGKQALTNADALHAIDHYRQAGAALKNLPAAFKNKDRYLVKCQLGLATALSIQNQYEDAKTVMEEIAKCLSAMNDSDRKLENKLKSLELFDCWTKGALTKGVELGYSFLKTLDLNLDPYNYVTTVFRLGGMLQEQGNYTASNEVLLLLRNFFKAEDQSLYGILFPPAPVCFAVISRNFGELGDFEQAEFFSEISLSLLKNNKNILSKIYTFSYSATYLVRAKKYEKAIPFLREAYELAIQMKTNLLYPFTAMHYGFCLFNIGKITEGMAIMEEGWQVAQRLSTAVRQSLCGQILAEAKFSQHEYQQAKELAHTAIEIGNKYGEQAHIARSCYIVGLAEYHLPAGDWQAALSSLKTAQTMATQLKLLPLIKSCQQVLAAIEMA